MKDDPVSAPPRGYPAEHVTARRDASGGRELRAERRAVGRTGVASDREVRLRLGLQRRAPRLLIRHLLRAARRVSVLIVVDLASFWVVRALLRAGILEAPAAWYAGRWVPSRILSGWQYAAGLLVGLVVMGSYGPDDQRRDLRRLFFAAALATALPLWMSIWTNGLAPVALEYVLTTLLVWAALGLGRLAVQKAVSRLRSVVYAPLRTLFVGPAEACRSTSASAAFANPVDHEVVGFADSSESPAADALGSASEVAEILRNYRVEVVVICGELADSAFEGVTDAALMAGCDLLAVPREHGRFGVAPRLLVREGQPLIQLTEPRLRGWQLVLKRLVDVAISLAVLVLASPVLVLIAVAIKLDSRGQVLFRQLRVGAGGRRFEVLKFRTMKDGAPEDVHRAYVERLLRDDTTANSNRDGKAPVFKLVGDERVTAVGRWLRRTSLDELPQLVNVLRGDMSLVGPRPALPYEIDLYEEWQFERLGVKPGITGLWQVSGRNRLTYRQMCELDAQYVRTWSLRLDLGILLRTVPVVVMNSGKAH